MGTVSVQKLKQQTSKILRRVPDTGEIIEVTYHGVLIAQISPIPSPEPSEEEISSILTSLNQLSAEISAQ